jgi:hypothetical protein
MKINNKLFYIFSLTSFISLVLACYFTRITFYPPDALYLFTSLNLFYWIGLSALIIVIILRILYPVRSVPLDLFIIFLVIGYTDIVAFIYAEIRYVDAYRLYWELLEPAIRSGTFSSDLITYPDLYHIYYNISTLFFSYILQLGFNPNFVFNVFPVFFHLFSALIVYSIGRFFSREYAVVGSIAFILFDWITFHYSPQSFTFLLIFLLLLSLFKQVQKKDKRYAIIAIVFVVIIAVSHMLSNLLIMGILTVIFITIFSCELLYKYNIMNGLMRINIPLFHRDDKKNVFRILIISILGYCTYALLYATGTFSKTIDMSAAYTENGMSIDSVSLTFRTMSELKPPSASYLLGYNIRMLSLGIYLATGIICLLFILYSFKYNDKIDNNHKKTLLFFVPIFLFAISVTAIFLLMGNNSYGYGRPYPISLIPLGIMIIFFISFSGSKKFVLAGKTLIILLFIWMLIMSPINKCAAEPYQFYSESRVQADEFLKSDYIDDIVDKKDEIISYSSFDYNTQELRYQSGDEYTRHYTSYNKIYDVGKSASHYIWSNVNISASVLVPR